MNKITTKLVTVVAVIGTLGTVIGSFNAVNPEVLQARYDNTMKAVEDTFNNIKQKNADAIGKMKSKIDHLNEQISAGDTDIAELQKELADMESEYDKTKKDLEQKTSDNEELQSKLDALQKEYDEKKAELEAEIADKIDKLNTLQSKLDALQKEYEEAVEAYEKEITDANNAIDGMKVESLAEDVQEIIDEYDALNEADGKLATDVQERLGQIADSYDEDLNALVDGYVDTNAGTSLGSTTLKLDKQDVECTLSYDDEGFYVNGSKLGMSMGEGYVYPASSSRQTAKVAIFNTTDNYLNGYQNSVTQVYSGSVQAGMNGFVDKDGAKGYAMASTYQNGSQKKNYTNPELWKNFFVGVFGVTDEQWVELQNDWNFDLLQPTHK